MEFIDGFMDVFNSGHFGKTVAILLTTVVSLVGGMAFGFWATGKGAK